MNILSDSSEFNRRGIKGNKRHARLELPCVVAIHDSFLVRRVDPYRASSTRFSYISLNEVLCTGRGRGGGGGGEGGMLIYS